VKNTGVIGSFKIISENGVAAGVRRIEALTGRGVRKYYADLEKTLEEAAGVVKASPDTLVEKCGHLMAEIKELQSENEAFKSKAAREQIGDVLDKVITVKGIRLLAASVDGVDMNGLRDLGDQLKNKIDGVILLASSLDGKVNLVSMASEEAVKKGAHAGNLIKEVAPLVGGGGGGRPNMAQAGGKNPEGISKVVAEAAKVLEAQIKG
jgi:alanyl-tRNA synthetase